MASYSPWKDERWLPGVLNQRQLIALKDAHVLGNIDIGKIDKDASALDLHLSTEAYIMKRGSVKPFKKDFRSILSDNYYAEKYLQLQDGTFLLERGHCYIFKLKESILPYIRQTKFYGQSTAKSTVGRIDLIARLIVDGMSEYETFVPEQITQEIYI